MQELATAKENLNTIEIQFKQLQMELQNERDKKETLQKEIQNCELKLERAKQLLSGLGGEKDRWLLSMDELDIKLNTVVPDMLAASAIIAYLGSFTQVFRK